MCGHRRDGIVLLAAAEERTGPSAVAHQTGPPADHHDLRPANLSPPAMAKTARNLTPIEHETINRTAFTAAYDRQSTKASQSPMPQSPMPRSRSPSVRSKLASRIARRFRMCLTVSAKNGRRQFTTALTTVLKGMGLNIVCGHKSMVEVQAAEVKCSQYSDSDGSLLASGVVTRSLARAPCRVRNVCRN